MVPSQLWHKILTWVFTSLTQNSYLSTFPNSCSLKISKQNSIISSNHWEISKNRKKKSVFGQNRAFPTSFHSFWVFEKSFWDLSIRFDFRSENVFVQQPACFNERNLKLLSNFHRKRVSIQSEIWWSKHGNFTVRVCDPGHSVSIREKLLYNVCQ